MKGTVEVTDLFRGAFLLCMGGRLDRVHVRNNGRKIATFLITGMSPPVKNGPTYRIFVDPPFDGKPTIIKGWR